MAFHNLVDLDKLGYFFGKVKVLLNGKVDKETGKGLSANDYTTNEKEKLGNIENLAQVNIIESVTVNGSALPVASKTVDVTVPTKLSDLTNDGDFVSDANYVHTDRNYTANEKEKLAGIAAGAQVNTITGVKGGAENDYRTGNVNITKDNLGLGNVENKSSVDIRSELTKKNVTDALGYTPPESDTSYEAMAEAEAKAGTATTGKLISASVLDAAIESKGYTDNVGTITGIKMNGAFVGTEGDINLGTVITEHQDISGKLDASLKGQANGLAELDAEGKVPASQLPSYVDDVVEYSGQSAFPAAGESGKIYVDTSTNKTYRWSGSAYVAVSSDIALGTTSSTAFRGDYGQAAYTHAVTNKGTAYTSGLYKITTNAEGHVTGATTVTKTDITRLGIPAQDTTYELMPAEEAAAGTATTARVVSAAGLKAAMQAQGYITGISMNGESKGTSGDVDLGTVITEHQDITGKADKASTVSDVAYDTIAKKIAKTINGTTSDVVSVATLKSDLNISKSDIGLGKVENTALSTWAGSANLTTCAEGDFGSIVTHDAGDFAAASHGTHVTADTVKAALGTGLGTTLYLREDGSWADPGDNDTKNTAGSTDTSDKIFLIGAKSQADNPQTYSQDTAYVGADGCLYSNSEKVLTSSSLTNLANLTYEEVT